MKLPEILALVAEFKRTGEAPTIVRAKRAADLLPPTEREIALGAVFDALGFPRSRRYPIFSQVLANQ